MYQGFYLPLVSMFAKKTGSLFHVKSPQLWENDDSHDDGEKIKDEFHVIRQEPSTERIFLTFRTNILPVSYSRILLYLNHKKKNTAHLLEYSGISDCILVVEGGRLTQLILWPFESPCQEKACYTGVVTGWDSWFELWYPDGCRSLSLLYQDPVGVTNESLWSDVFLSFMGTLFPINTKGFQPQLGGP